jgi:hypothetical protein
MPRVVDYSFDHKAFDKWLQENKLQVIVTPGFDRANATLCGMSGTGKGVPAAMADLALNISGRPLEISEDDEIMVPEFITVLEGGEYGA